MFHALLYLVNISKLLSLHLSSLFLCSCNICKSNILPCGVTTTTTQLDKAIQNSRKSNDNTTCQHPPPHTQMQTHAQQGSRECVLWRVGLRCVRTTLVHGPNNLNYAEVRGHNTWQETGVIIHTEKEREDEMGLKEGIANITSHSVPATQMNK